ncbi:MAG: DUF4249 family protein [Lentimicrobiaceae bacterium]|jgi:hypothetical protein|nr:DUF4249 family protein [Lentimicrobiaceae bacterium]MCP4909225.1 DUF4249 family protein [Bacteroidota bacterium]MBT3453571.1 DUF4249 family protein [Lentimicrobiaceae bacterium]MBT3818912.1 DUF4249 family protein [Lentimicrobiaceae bacterium]MBT4060435.1 DUF4249 family protein [Lentimicrobiaceae bacterium]
MTRGLLLILTVIIALCYSSCSTDFDMYAEYKDVTIVYSIVDMDDDTTWVKITKAYTGPGNALLLAQNPDSSNYPYKLNGVITGKKNGVLSEPLLLDTITITNKATIDTIINSDGDTTVLNPFYAPNQLMYFTSTKLNKDYVYSLTIEKNNGETLSSSTGLVNNFSVSKPVNRIVFSETADNSIEWTAPKNGVMFEVSLKFNYTEYAPGYSDTLNKSISWYVGTRNAKTSDGGESMDVSYSGPYFYSLLVSELPDVPNVTRWAGKVDITIASGSQVLATYLDINSGGASLLEEVPVYSNIDGGTGIFASRYTTTKEIQLSTTTERNLIENYNLGFKFKN